MKFPSIFRWPLALALTSGVAVSCAGLLNQSQPGGFTAIGLPAKGGSVAPKAAPAAKVVTFNKDIAPIIYSNCSSCHRAGEVAPFPLLSYDDAKKRAKQIAIVTESHVMPPWKADEGKEKFADAHQLSMDEIAKIRQWTDAGAPEGAKADLPPAPKFAQGWQNGEPDAIFQATEAYNLAAEGDDVYRCYVIPTNYTEDRYVSAMEVRPGNHAVVHHVIAYLDTSGKAREKDAADPGPGYTSFGGIGVTPAGSLGGWAPGLVPRLADAGEGILLPKGADIVLQVHYHKSGKPETDLTKIGVYFAKGPVDKRIRSMMVINPLIRIPAGDANYTTTATRKVRDDITVLSITPHMHLLGKDMQISAALPDGSEKKLVHVNDWDFNWQMIYGLKQPMKLPAGTQVNLTARYDNSTDNPLNPTTPPRTVTWGEQTTDEMCIAFLFYTVDSEHLTKGEVAETMPGGGGGGILGGLSPGLRQMAMKLFDKDGDGKLNEEERQTALAWWRDHGAAIPATPPQ
ncbi:hypothetical protein IAD21_02769 [Abditibacteriota bacterium]|nr:hypothetical protein IAD21_02769 [Abditibacteriota bacterium]